MEQEALRSSSERELSKPSFRRNPNKEPTSYVEPREKSSQGLITDEQKEKISVLLLNADILIGHQDKSLAIHLIRQALFMNPRNPEALRRLLICTDMAAEPNQYLEIQKQLLKNDYGFQSLSSIGNSYYRLGQDQQASKYYLEALSTLTFEQEGLFEVYKNLGNILVKERDFEGAEEYYNKAFTLNSQSDVLQVNLGTLDLQRDQFESALSRFRAALELNPKNDKAWVGLALVHNTMGDHFLATANLENAIEINPLNRTAIQLSAAWAVRDFRYEPAIENLQRYLSETEFDGEISLVLTHLFCLSGQLQLARIEVERHLLWDPKNEQALAIAEEIRAQA